MAFSDEQKKKVALALAQGKTGITRFLTQLIARAPQVAQATRDTFEKIEKSSTLKSKMTPAAYEKLLDAQRQNIEFWERLCTVEGVCDFTEMWVVIFTEAILAKAEAETGLPKDRLIKKAAMTQLAAEEAIKVIGAFRATHAS